MEVEEIEEIVYQAKALKDDIVQNWILDSADLGWHPQVNS